MSSGGARVRSGPPRDPNALRRSRPSDRGGFVHLPASGRDGEPPPWPLPGRMTRYEVETWARLWRRPEAIEWERLGMEDQVALYVRALRESAKLGAAAARTTTLLRQQNELGLSIAGRAANRWIIDDAPAPSAAPRRESTSTAKDRIRLLTGGKDARAS